MRKTRSKFSAVLGPVGGRSVPWIAAGLAAAIFAVDALPAVHGDASVLYFLVVIAMAASRSWRWIAAAAGVAAVLALAAFGLAWMDGRGEGGAVRLAVSLGAIAVTAAFLIRDHIGRAAITEQARLLELTHDTVIIRDLKDNIVYWNDGAEKLFGWSRAEALGQPCAALLQCAFPNQDHLTALQDSDQWSGEVTRVRRDGSRVVMTTRWLARRSPNGCRTGVVEVSADVTEQTEAAREREFSERRYKAIFHAAGYATWEADWSGLKQYLEDATRHVEGDLYTWLLDRPEILQAAAGKAVIREINQAAVNLFELESPEELVGSNVLGRMPLGWEEGFARILARVAEGAEVAEAELRMTTTGGRTLDVVMRATPVPDGKPWSRALVMAFDETERKEARARLEEAKAELAHAARISTLGQLAASIAHEVKQPLTAVTTYGKSGKRWLNRPEPDVAEALQCFDHIASNATRAVAVIDRVRAQARKAGPQAALLDLPTLVTEAVALVQREAEAAEVTVRRGEDEDLPPVWADRVQVQQVLVNLLINGVQAMRQIRDRRRELCIDVRQRADGVVEVSVQDCGTGISGDPNRIFEPFFTTKQEGMGLGLSICKSIIQDQGGRIYAANNSEHGATVTFELPVAAQGAAPEPNAFEAAAV